MGTFYGADVSALRQLGQRFKTSRETLSRLDATLSQNIEAARQWTGPDGRQFRADWSANHRKALAEARTLLGTAERAILRNADEQENASRGGSSTGSGASAPGDATGNTPGGLPDHSVPRFPDRGKPDLSEDRLKDLRDKIHAAADPDNFFKGNDSDVEELRKALEGLTPAQLDQLLGTLSDDELKALGQGLSSDGKGMFNWEGTTAFERQAVLDQLLAKASPEQMERVKAQIPWAQPDGIAAGDAANPDGGPQTPKGWVTPPGPVISSSQSTLDIRQGGYGDCVVMAGLGSLINQDPNWARDHVTDNGNGTVSVKLNDGGQERWVTVTKDVPADENGNPQGAKGNGGGTWAMYVEKALAQVYNEDNASDPVNPGAPADKRYEPGHYRAIEGNYGTDAMKYLTDGNLSETHSSSDVWKAADAGRPVIIGTHGEAPPGAPDGYVAGHEFFVTGVDDSGKLVLQNPWGPHKEPLHITKEQYESMFGNAVITG